MGKWYKQFEALIWAATVGVGLLTYAYSSFATKEYVNEKHAGVMEVLNDIRTDVKTIEQRTYDLAQRKR